MLVGLDWEHRWDLRLVWRMVVWMWAETLEKGRANSDAQSTHGRTHREKKREGRKSRIEKQKEDENESCNDAKLEAPAEVGTAGQSSKRGKSIMLQGRTNNPTTYASESGTTHSTNQLLDAARTPQPASRTGHTIWRRCVEATRTGCGRVGIPTYYGYLLCCVYTY